MCVGRFACAFKCIYLSYAFALGRFEFSYMSFALALGRFEFSYMSMFELLMRCIPIGAVDGR